MAARVYMATQPWGVLQDVDGDVQATTSATIKNRDGTNATHYSARTAGTSSTSAIVSSATGELERWIDPGEYTMTVGATTKDIEASTGGARRWFPVPTGSDDAAELISRLTAGENEITLRRDDSYTWTQAVSLPAGASLRGVGKMGSVVTYTGSGHALLVGSASLDVDDPWTGHVVEHIKIVGTASGLSGIRVRGSTRWELSHVGVEGFTTGAGILLNGASFQGTITGGRVTDCSIGVSAKKVTGDGAAGEGQAFNAVEICGQFEAQNNGWGIQIGNPTLTETAPVVGQGANIHDCTIQGNTTGGLWNVSANRVGVRDCYFEGNPVHIRQGSDDGNTSQPVLCTYRDNFLYLGGPTFPLAIDFVRGIKPRVQDNYVVSDGGTTTAYQIDTVNVTGFRYLGGYENNVTNRFAGALFGNFEATASVASAATITIPAGAEFVLVSGTTTITSITAGYPGQTVDLIMGSTAQITDGSNLNLAGNFTGAANRLISLRADATNWYETSRAAT
jgi:hypothetical protein